MRKRPAGKRYPHVTTDATTHDHRYCPVVAAIARRIADGREQGGLRHVLPAVPDERNDDGTGADDIKRGLYRARSCRQLTLEGVPQRSVQADYERLPDGTWQPWVRVWDRAEAKREITRRVKAGEPLPYNVMRARRP